MVVFEYIITHKDTILPIISLFFITLLASVLGNLKTLAMVKSNGVQKYVLTFFDAAMFALIMKNIGKGEGISFILAYVIGRLLGMYFTDIVESRVINTVYLAHLYLLEENIQEMQEYLLIEGISFTKLVGKFLDKDRILLTIHLNETQKTKLLDKLTSIGITNPNIDFTELKTVSGSIKERT